MENPSQTDLSRYFGAEVAERILATLRAENLIRLLGRMNDTRNKIDYLDSLRTLRDAGEVTDREVKSYQEMTLDQLDYEFRDIMDASGIEDTDEAEDDDAG